MNLVSLRLITADIKRLVSFYERITGIEATWYTDDFAEVCTPTATLAIGSARTLELFGQPFELHDGSESSSRGGPAIIEYLVADVDAVYEARREAIEDLIQEPTTMPWGNRSLLFRDPDGNVVNFFTPVTPQSLAKFRR